MAKRFENSGRKNIISHLPIVYLTDASPRGLQRQFQRLIEMIQLLRLDVSDASAVRAYRLQVKERLYRFNFVRLSAFWWTSIFTHCTLQEALAQVEKQERLDKLEETFQSVQEDYQRILAMIR